MEDDWHTAAQLHPLDDLGVIDDETSSAIMMMGRTDVLHIIAGSGKSVVVGGKSGGVLTDSQQSKMVGAGDDIMREFMEAFFPVILLILLEIYSQQILQFPLA